MTHYDALEVSPRASPEVIRAAYKSLMQRFHPDRNPSDEVASARAVQVAGAYAVLSDPAKKALYDKSLQPAMARLAPVHAANGYAAEATQVPPKPVRRTTTQPARARDGAKGPGLWAVVGTVAFLVVAAILSVKGLRGADLEPAAELRSIRASMAADTTRESLRRELYSRKQEILDAHPELLPRLTEERVQDMAARTFFLLDRPLVVWVAGGQASGALPVELTIPSISVFFGSFDAPNLLAEMARHRERLSKDLARQLASEDPRQLSNAQVEQHLARVVTRSVSVSLGVAATRGDYPSTYFESPGRYGVTHVFFPDSFRMVQLRP
ncbi:J domain-containing protein [Rhodoferax sp. PAMC 29310]|uniref:J domain-containing protein n=1 Tax=Rhodoferax sp. PAMC 29310 TaxID=2822760 RepID=UPI001B32A1C0|nr:J domain-containing protein [Rhodoferax sp. PAMC 29310]